MLQFFALTALTAIVLFSPLRMLARKRPSTAIFILALSAASLATISDEAHAATQSASCQAINSDWNGGRSISTATAIPGQANNDYKEYSDLEPGETISWSVTASGTLGSNNYANFWVAEPISGKWEEFDDTKTSGPFTRSGSRTLAEDETTVGLEVIVNYQSANLPPAEVTMSVTCAAADEVELPVPSDMSTTVAYNSTNNSIPIAYTGGTPTELEIDTGPTNGTLVISGLNMRYTPNASFYGADTFKFKALNSAGASAPTTVSITVASPVPLISSISPNQGPTTGGTAVTISGQGLGAATAVSIGGQQALITGSPGLHSVTATTPSGSAGSRDVVVITPGGSATIVGGYTYSAPPSLTVAPSAGPLPSGTVGTSYSQTFTASGGDGSYEYVLSGDHPPGLSLDRSTGTLSGTPTVSYNFSFTVIATDGSGSEGRTSYTLPVVKPAPSISSISPTSGPVAGGTSVTINGSNFAEVNSISFGGTTTTDFSIENDGQRIVVTTPAHAASEVDVTVSALHAYVIRTGAFTYKAVSSDARLADIWVGAGTLSPTFDPQVTSYEVTLPAETTGIWMNAATVSSEAWFIAGGAERRSGSSWLQNLTLGANQVQVVGLAEDRTTTKIYTVTIIRGSAAVETSTTLTASPNPSFVGQSVTLTATVSPVSPATGTPTGSVTFSGPNGLNETVTLDGSGRATFSSTSLASGTVTATYSGGAGFVGSSAAVGLAIGTASTTTSVTATPNPSLVGQTVSMTATVAPVAPATDIPAGSVTFTGPDGLNETVSLDASGKATISSSSLASGTVTVAYNGSEAFGGSVGTVDIAVELAATETTMAATPNPSIIGESVSVTAIVAPVSLSSSVPTGSVTFVGPNGLNETVSVDGSGKATLVSSALSSGTIVATYSGNTAFASSVGTIGLTVGVPATETTVTATPNPSVVGEAVVLKAKVVAIAPATAIPAGSVTFTGPNGLNQAAALDGTGTATLSSSSLSSGTITASFSGSPHFLGSSGTVAITVGNASTETLVTATPNPSKVGDAVEITVTVKATAPATGVPAGEVNIVGPNGFRQTATLNNQGIATVRTTTLTSGTVTASYSGNGPYAGSKTTLAINVEETTKFVFSPAGGALEDAMAGEEYSQPISAKGGIGSLIYALAFGKLPDGMILNVSTGELTGPSAVDSGGEYNFAIRVRDSKGNTAEESFSLKVLPREVTVTDKVINVPAGQTPANVYLNRGATGGPFSSADLTFVEPSNAGTATIIQGELAQAGPVTRPVGWYLQFTPNPAFSGQARVGFRLTSSLGASNTGTVAYNLGYDAGQVAEDVDALVHGFVRTRQNLISSNIKVPGLLERRQMASTSEAVTTRISPSVDGMTMGFSTSLAQIEGARDAADGISDGAMMPFNLWASGTFMAHNREENGDKWGSFATASIGADYLLTEKALIGLSFHYDYMVDPTDEDAELKGNGWLAGPNTSFEIGKGVFWDTSILYGGSSNDIDTAFWDGTFDTTRWLFDTSLNGRWQIDEVTVVTPKLRGVYFSEEVDDYAVRNGAGDTIELDGFTEEQFRISLGAEIARQFTLKNEMTITPKIGGTIGYWGLDGDGAFGSISAGVSLRTVGGWDAEAGLLFNIEADGQVAAGAKAGLSKQF